MSAHHTGNSSWKRGRSTERNAASEEKAGSWRDTEHWGHISKTQFSRQVCCPCPPVTYFIWLSSMALCELQKGWKQSNCPSEEGWLNHDGTSMQRNIVWSLKRMRQLYTTDMSQLQNILLNEKSNVQTSVERATMCDVYKYRVCVCTRARMLTQII